MSLLFSGLLNGFVSYGSLGQEPSSPLVVYQKIKAFALGGASVRVEELTMNRDAIELTFTGNFYFAEPVEDAVLGAVFLGAGRLRATPSSAHEKESLKRFVSQESAEVTFTKAVLRFSDYTYNTLAGYPSAGPIPEEARQLASRLNERLIRENSLNIASRLLTAIENRDEPGVFFAEVDGGREGRFDAFIDYQTRSLSGVFGINRGEKGILFRNNGLLRGSDVWMAFYSKQDLQRGVASYADAFDLVSIPSYRMEVDLRDPGDWLRLTTHMEIVAAADHVRVIPMRLNQGLALTLNERRDKKLRVLDARMDNGAPAGVIQEEWEDGFSLILPVPLSRGQRATVTVRLEGRDSLLSYNTNFHYPRSTTGWYPRHGDLNRATYQMTFRHRQHLRVASMGERVRQVPIDGNPDDQITEWVISDPVLEVTFVCGNFQVHQRTTEINGTQVPLEYYSLRSGAGAIDEKFILEEIGASLRFFSSILGEYRYPRLAAAYSLGHYGEGFPMLLLLQDTTEKNISGIAHATAHQWWGSTVAWRSYRDQWLSDGLAEYSRLLYTGWRLRPKDAKDMVDWMHYTLTRMAPMDVGMSKQMLSEVGPLVLGRRLDSSRSRGGQLLNNAKGAAVIRMLHYLLTDRASGDSALFVTMMKDFVMRHRDTPATTESFMQVASEHFARSSMGESLGLKDLNWFMAQWVYRSEFPSYHLNYRIEQRVGGKWAMTGEILQRNVSPNWFMPLPVDLQFSGNRRARATVIARGPKAPVEIMLSEKPQSVRLDPDHWILAEKTSESRQ